MHDVSLNDVLRALCFFGVEIFWIFVGQPKPQTWPGREKGRSGK